MMTFTQPFPLLRLRAAFTVVIAAFTFAIAAPRSDAQGIGRGKNIINDRFATVSSGPQEALIIDVPTGKGAATQPTVERRLRAAKDVQHVIRIGSAQFVLLDEAD